MTMHLLGPTGELIGITDWLGQLPRHMSRQTTINVAMGGRSVSAQQGMSVLRDTPLTIPHLTPHEVGALEELFTVHTGWWWLLSAWARTHNALLPHVLPATPLDLGPDGWAPHSVTHTAISAQVEQVEPVPVIPGEPVTVSAWGTKSSTGTGAFGLRWLDSFGASVGVSPLAQFGTGLATRVAMTVTPPAGAVLAQPRVNTAAGTVVTTTRWALTHTPAMTTWTSPAAAKVVATALGIDPTSAAELDGLASEADSTITLTEVTR